MGGRPGVPVTLDADGGHLDRQGKAVQPAANLGDSRCVGGGLFEAGLRQLRSLDTRLHPLSVSRSGWRRPRPRGAARPNGH